MGEQPHRRSTKKAARGRSMRVSPTQSRKRVKGQCPLQGAGTASLLGFGATPQLFRVKSTQRKKSTRCRQRSVPASNFARPQTRPQVTKKTSTEKRIVPDAGQSRPSGATMLNRLKEQLGGASEEAQSYWQGRFAACDQGGRIERVWHNWSPVEQLGRCPKPHQRRRFWTPQGAIAP